MKNGRPFPTAVVGPSNQPTRIFFRAASMARGGTRGMKMRERRALLGCSVLRPHRGIEAVKETNCAMWTPERNTTFERRVIRFPS